MKKQLSIIVPVYNEGKSIGLTIEKLKKELYGSDLDFEIIVVNDASTDETKNILETIEEIKTINHHQNKGYGASLKTGIANAQFNNLLFFDADGQHKSEYIKEMIKYIDEFDLISGTRVGYKGPIIRQPGKRLLLWLANYLAQQKIPDLNCGLRIIKKDKISKFLHLLCNGLSFSTTTLLLFATEGHTIKYIPITINKRIDGKSTVKPRHALDTLIFILRIVLVSEPLRIFLPITGLLIIFAIISFVSDMIYSYNTNIHISITTLFLSVSSILIFFFGLLADQLAAIRREIKK